MKINETVLRKIIREELILETVDTQPKTVDVVNDESGEVLSIPTKCPDDVFKKLRVLVEPLKSPLAIDTHMDVDAAAEAAFRKLLKFTTRGMKNSIADRGDRGLTGQALDDTAVDRASSGLSLHPAERDTIMKAYHMTRKELINKLAKAVLRMIREKST
jgi:hypothetical protein